MSEIFKMVQEISRMQLNAMKSKDSGWTEIPMPAKYRNRGLRDYSRMLYIDHEPTETYIATLLSSAPDHNGRPVVTKVHDQETGLWCISLSVTMDSSD